MAVITPRDQSAQGWCNQPLQNKGSAGWGDQPPMTQVDRNEVTVIKGINGTALQHAGHSRIKALCHLSQLCLVLESAYISLATICPGSIIFCLSCCWPGTISLMFDTKRAKWDPPSFPVFDPLWSTRLLSVGSPVLLLSCC